jgi:hypothetical protein
MLSLFAASTAFNGPALRAQAVAASHVQMAALDDLKAIASEQNPVIGYWDPMNLALLNFWGQGEEATVGFLEIFSEHSYILEAQGQKHYMRGGKPGYFPSLKQGFGVHPVPFDLFDPLDIMTNATPEQKAKRLNMEVNNGRLAMYGIMGLVAESKVPGSVPFGPKLAEYTGEVMQPFADKVWYSPF